jgi:uncharacterized protein
VKLRWLIFVLLMPVTAAFAAEPSATAENLRIVQVDGHGLARSDPDQAFMSFAIETKGSTAKEAGEQNAQIASKVVAALKSKLASGGKVETGGYSLTPLYGGRSGQSESRIRDWIASDDLMVETDPSIAGNVLDAAQAAGADGSSTINEQTGKAMVQLRISARALTAVEASKLGDEKARKVAEAINAKLGGKGTLRIEQGSVQSENEQFNNQVQQEIIGYQSSNSITVETGAIDQVGSLIDTAIAAGANRANFVNFNLRDDSKARREAISAACRDAQLKANAAAQSLGLKVRRVIKIMSAGDFQPQQGGYGAGMASFSASVTPTTPIKPGELTVNATVTVTYELE